jgi:hypothetical protein
MARRKRDRTLERLNEIAAQIGPVRGSVDTQLDSRGSAWSLDVDPTKPTARSSSRRFRTADA